MLLYNQRKEFIGIDEDDLASLGFNNIADLMSESEDFADLFVKKPGFIHNFKNFSWIDFILHSEAEESKAIIHAKGTNYSCVLHVAPFYFTSDETGFIVHVRNVRALKGAEDAQANKDLEASGGIQAPVKPTPVEKVAAAPEPEPAAPEINISLDDISADSPSEDLEIADTQSFELPSFEQDSSLELQEPDPLDIPEPAEIDLGLSSGVNEFGAPLDIDYNEPLTLDDDVMQDDFALPEEETVSPVDETTEPQTPKREEKPMLGDYVSGGSADSEYLSELVRSGDYKYDPNVAANELGLPVDLIEEFIGDFIDQAHEFHDDLFASLESGDFDNVQVLSHKLKGVAANLRVEDAFDVLSVVNTSKDTEEVMPNLQHFYKIIARLEGKEVPEPAAPATAPLVEEPLPEEVAPTLEEDENIGIKTPDEGPMLIDEEVTPLHHEDDDDDLYADLLSDTPAVTTDEPQIEASPEPSLDDDLYDDLLASAEPLPEHADEDVPAVSSFDDEDLYDDLLGAPEPVMEAPAAEDPSLETEDDLYDDLLGAPSLDTTEPEPLVESVPETPAASSTATLNFDPQTSANELGIPLDIVNEFVQEFKEQIASHEADFENALVEGNIQKINRTATLLKGMSDNLRLNEISEVLKQLQSEKDINNTATPLASLRAYSDQL